MDIEELKEEVDKVREKCHDQAMRITTLDLRLVKLETKEFCPNHTTLSQQSALTNQTLQNILEDNKETKKFIKEHINEAEKEGGVRDRVKTLEISISELKKAEWLRLGGAGLVGGLIGSGCTDAIQALIQWFIKK